MGSDVRSDRLVGWRGRAEVVGQRVGREVEGQPGHGGDRDPDGGCHSDHPPDLESVEGQRPEHSEGSHRLDEVVP